MMIRTRFIAAALACAFAPTGCSTLANGPRQALSVDERHPIAVDSQVVSLTLDVSSASRGLTDLDRARLRAFARAYLQSGHGPLAMTTPSGSAADAAAGVVAEEARAELDAAGVEPAALQSAGYRDAADRRSLVFSFTHYVATPSACGLWTSTSVTDFRNINSPNFGCATQNNLAVVIADPRDLSQPAGVTAADANARNTMFNKFRRGEVTSSATDDDIKSTIAQSN